MHIARFVAGAAAVLAFLPGCGDGSAGASSSVAAVTLETGRFASLMASSQGDVLLPIVDRDAAGKVVGGVKGVLWMDARGGRIAVLLDPVTGLPARAVAGDYVVRFANWDTVAGRVDVALVYGPTGYVKVVRSVPVPAARTGAAKGAVSSALTCFPACATDLQNASEALKIAGVGLSIVSCMTASAATLGALLVPCGGALVSAAALVVPDDPWLDDVDGVGRCLALGDALKCSRGSALDCVSFYTAFAGDALAAVDATLAKHAPAVAVAEQALFAAGPAAPAGVVQGAAPPCGTAYECTPGTYLPCLAGGTRKCGADCRFAECPAPGTDPVEEVGRFDGAWTFELSFGPCGPTSDLPVSGTFSIANGVFSPGVLFTYDAHGTMETVTLLRGTVDARGAVDGYFSLLGDGCNDEESNFYGYLTSPTAGYATSYWGSIKFRR